MANSGQFKKGNRAAANRGKKNQNAKYIRTQNKVKTTVIQEQKETDRNNYDYLKFGDDNLFPQHIAELNRKSPVSRAVVNSKRDYIVGAGFETESDLWNNYKFNSKESAWDISSKLFLDRLYFGNMWLEIVKEGDSLMFFHIDATKVRYEKERMKIMVHPDWSKYTQYKTLTKVYPKYPLFEKVEGLSGMRSIMHIADYEPTFSSYGIPSNIASEDSGNINYKTNRWNHSRLVNSFQSSGILLLNADFEDEDAKMFSEDFDATFTDEGNTGKPLKVITPATGERNDTKWIPFNGTTDGDWTSLHDQAIKEICTANQWFPTLSGINVPSGWDTERIRNEYQIALNTIIMKEQKVLLDMWKKVFRDQTGQDLEDLSIINKPPINMADIDNIYEAIIAINTEVQENRMSVDVAKMTLKLSYNLSSEDVENLFE